MKNRFKKLILALLLSFCASISLFSAANAEEWATVSSITELKTQVALGGNIKLGADIALDENMTIEKDLVLDLNGRTLTTGTYSFTVASNVTIQDEVGTGKMLGNRTYMIYVGSTQPGTLTLKSGTITNNKMAAVMTRANGTFIMDGGRVEASGFTSYNSGRFVLNDGVVFAQSSLAVRLNTEDTTMEMNGGTIEARGKDATALQLSRGEAVINGGKILAPDEGGGGIILFGNTKLTVNDVDVQAEQSALSGNGTTSPSEQNYGGNVTLVINGGKFNGGSCSLYLPQPFSTTVINGGTFTGGEVAAEIRASIVEINGGTFTATAPNFEIKSNTNGTTATGSAIAVAQHTTKQEIGLTIRGGTFNSAVPLSEANPEHNDAESIAKVKIKIIKEDDGSIPQFTSTAGQTVYSENLTGFIYAGFYSNEIDMKFVAPEYIQETRTGGFIVTKKSEEKEAEDIVNPPTEDELTKDIAIAIMAVSILIALVINKIYLKSSTSA